ncbi:MAG: HIT domain-containing protein [Candidatus Woesearchaeota archaeon]|jgi:histidine triad (HIT) family protein|nr:HIT domain-containing protein [Candidatus Woesearchaeota archaeon]MDP7506374.1 HIT domain-containing protein [Candidatus Woesearchaeota archaeon]MDP7610774.1 HIT domain-containing protein [Candidatus Woesearchaeota archaeon]|tara:strand:+ start:851 stop:1582 length:732 start_codon:yes stop_codon:yes gene_type:complete
MEPNSQMTPEQAQAMQEKVKNMSPEELKEFQKQQCIFCHIAEGKMQAKKVYEDDKVIAVLDINPANAGHILLLPKEHYAIMPLMPDDLISYISMVAKALSNAMLKALKVEGTNIFIANGMSAGQKAQHFMMHIIPRNKNDNLPLTVPKMAVSKPDMEKLKEIVTKKVNEIFGIKEEKPKKAEDKEKEKKEEKKPKKTKQKIVDAEFKEIEKKIKKKSTAKKSKKKKEEEEASLDDITNVLNNL